MTVSPPLKIAIIGGGPGGLATLIALSKIPNVEVDLYEQATVLREVGAGISIGANSWKVLDLLGVRGMEGHETWRVGNYNGHTGELLHLREKERKSEKGSRAPIRTQRTTLQSSLLSRIPPSSLHLSKKLASLHDHGSKGILLTFTDTTTHLVDLVIGADGIRSVVRDAAFPDYELRFTGTTIWRTLLRYEDVADLDERFGTTAWWHAPESHVYFSKVGEGRWEIAARKWEDPEGGGGEGKVSWGVGVGREVVEREFVDYLPQIRTALSRSPPTWRQFAAFAGPELPTLTAWSHRLALVGDASHALSGAFGSGAGFAMEDGWILARCLEHFRNDREAALNLFNEIRLPYYARMYAYLREAGEKRREKLKREDGREASFEEKVRAKVVGGEGGLEWIYGNDIERVWREAIGEAIGEVER